MSNDFFNPRKSDSLNINSLMHTFLSKFKKYKGTLLT